LTQERKDIRLLNLEALIIEFEQLGEKKFRANQVYEWLWKKGAIDFESMTNLSKDLRGKLEEKFVFRPIKTDTVQKSNDGTVKSRFKLFDGSMIESVLIPVEKDERFTLCVSSQVGCSLACKFCATGQMKRVRNLDPGEIYDQFKLVNEQSLQQYGKPLTNIVYMGMGEPLLTYKNVIQSIDHICEDFGLSSKRITISTAGIGKMIKKLADDRSKVNLALSLHAADDLKRNQIMPINEQNNIEVLMDALHYYYQKTKNRISYEYICFNGFNDSIEDAEKLYHLCKKFPVRVNIIEYNPIPGVDYIKSDEDQINKFASYLREKGIMVTVRRSRGKDIDAACGQLANK
jgi:23S rRNA (adenine2503-C2)-methyltransferase